MVNDKWDDHVLDHGPFVELAPRLWQVTGRLKRGNMPRNMAVHKLSDGTLMVHSVIALDAKGLAAMARLGQPSVMIVPNGFHRLDAGVWKQKFPDMQVVAPEGARKKVEEKVPCNGTAEALLPARGVKVHKIPGTKDLELCYEVDVDGGKGLLFTDTFFNLEHRPGVDGWLFRILGSTGFFGMTAIGRLFMLKEKPTFRAWITAMAERQDIMVVTVGHGEAIKGAKACSAALAAAAARL